MFDLGVVRPSAQLLGIPLGQRGGLDTLDVQVSCGVLADLGRCFRNCRTRLLVPEHIPMGGLTNSFDLVRRTEKQIAVLVPVYTILGGSERLLRRFSVLEVFQLCTEKLLIPFHHDDVLSHVITGQWAVLEVVGECTDIFVFQDCI